MLWPCRILKCKKIPVLTFLISKLDILPASTYCPPQSPESRVQSPGSRVQSPRSSSGFSLCQPLGRNSKEKTCFVTSELSLWSVKKVWSLGGRGCTGGGRFPGLNLKGLNSEGLNSKELNSKGLKSKGLNSEGLYSKGLNLERLNSKGFNSQGLNSKGLNSEGLKSKGLNSKNSCPRRRYWIFFSQISNSVHFERTTLMRIKVMRTQWEISDVRGKA